MAASRPAFDELPLKISPNRDEMTTRNPKSISAHTACSREDPVPKSEPATSTEPWLYGSTLRTNDGSARHEANRPSSNPVRVTRLR